MTDPRLARRMATIAPFQVMAILARARVLEASGRRIIHMEVGETAFPTPAAIVSAAEQALAAGKTRYTEALGLPELRAAVATDYRQRQGVADIDSQRIIITPGASGALQLVLAAMLDHGDDVLMADPGYPCYRHFVRLFGARACLLPVTAETNYQLTAAQLEANWTAACKVVLLASPANPTGAIIDPVELARIIALVRRRGACLIVDEIYQGLIYSGLSETALRQGNDIFVVNSFSKFFCMTGWRLGWLVAPVVWLPALERLAQNMFLAAATVAQHAALAAFSESTMTVIEGYRQTLQRRRDFLLQALSKTALKVSVLPQGAFYLYVDCSHYSHDSETFCRQLLEQAGVATTPGCDFGEYRAGEHLRLAYTADDDDLREGVKRIVAFLKAAYG